MVAGARRRPVDLGLHFREKGGEVGGEGNVAAIGQRRQKEVHPFSQLCKIEVDKTVSTARLEKGCNSRLSSITSNVTMDLSTIWSLGQIRASGHWMSAYGH